MEDVRVYRGADAGSGHELMIASLKVRLAKAPVTVQQRTKRFDISRLSSPDKRHDFCNALQNRYQTLTDQDEHFIDAKWEDIRASYHATGDENLGFRKRDLQELVKSRHHCKDRGTQDHQEPTSSSQDKGTETGSPEGMQRTTEGG